MMSSLARYKWQYDFVTSEANTFKLKLWCKIPKGIFRSILDMILKKQSKINVNIDYNKLDTFTLLPDQKPLAYRTLKVYLQREVNQVFNKVRADGINPTFWAIKNNLYKKLSADYWQIELYLEGDYSLLKV